MAQTLDRSSFLGDGEAGDCPETRGLPTSESAKTTASPASQIRPGERGLKTRREAEGHAVYHLEVGQPSTPAPRGVVEAARRMLDSDKLGYTVTLGLQFFRSTYTTNWAYLMAASLVTTLPVIVVFFAAQRYFIEGITLTGVKG